MTATSTFRFLGGCWALVIAVATAMADEPNAPEIFPLDAIKPGLTGTTYTVLQGTKIEPIHTEIYGVVRNAIGPGHDMILARLNDDKTRLTFAVHGMSGSPLYIDGKIVGALSRRVTMFEKDAFCGFTPIRDMLEVGRQPAVERPPAHSPANKLAGIGAWFRPMGGESGMVFQPLLTPLVIAGLPPRAFSIWARAFGDSIFLPVMGGGGAVGGTGHVEGPFEPGAPVTGLLARGSFTIGGTGTLTYRSGNRIYAFGHPMLGFGGVQMPMARAEILATVPSYSYPYKVSNIGQVIGTITQDRLTAISGEVGPVPHMVPMDIELAGADGRSQTFHLDLFDHAELTPRLVETVLASTTLLSLDYTREFSMALEGEIVLQGLPSVKITDFYSGDDADRFGTVMDVGEDVDSLYNNPFGEAKIQKIVFRAKLGDRRREFAVEDAWIDRDTVKPGESVTARVTLRPYQGEARTETISVALPEELKSGTVKLLVGDADAMRRAEMGAGSTTSSGKSDAATSVLAAGSAHENPRSLAQIVELLNKSRPHNFLYYRLSRVTPGEIVQDQRLTSLPPSAIAVRESKRTRQATVKLTEAPLLEKRVPVDGVVSGSTELTIKVE